MYPVLLYPPIQITPESADPDKRRLAYRLVIPFVAFSDSYTAAIDGAVLRGASTGMQEAVLRSAAAGFPPPGGRGFAYGIFNTIYCGAWFAGSVVIGVLSPGEWSVRPGIHVPHAVCCCAGIA